jgi:hypothetical protein
MLGRLWLLRLTTGLLYFGPLLAGLNGQGGWVVLVFSGIFLVFSVIVQPELWPRAGADLARPEAAVALAALTATQVLLVVACFGIGRGIGGVLAFEPALPAYLPTALSFASVPLARLVWPAEAAAPMGGATLVAPGPAAARQDRAEAAKAMLAQLMAQGEDMTEEMVQHHVSAISDHADPAVLRQALGDLAAGPSLIAVKALIVHATDPAASNLLSGAGYQAQAFAAAGRNPDLLALFARRCLMALEDEPDLAADCPAVAALTRAAQDCHDPVAATALNRLAGFLEQTLAPGA